MRRCIQVPIGRTPRTRQTGQARRSMASVKELPPTSFPRRTPDYMASEPAVKRIVPLGWPGLAGRHPAGRRCPVQRGTPIVCARPVLSRTSPRWAAKPISRLDRHLVGAPLSADATSYGRRLACQAVCPDVFPATRLGPDGGNPSADAASYGSTSVCQTRIVQVGERVSPFKFVKLGILRQDPGSERARSCNLETYRSNSVGQEVQTGHLSPAPQTQPWLIVTKSQISSTD